MRHRGLRLWCAKHNRATNKTSPGSRHELVDRDTGAIVPHRSSPMAQAAFEFAPPPVAALRQPQTGFEIGWDHAHYGLVPPAEHLHPAHPLRQGWDAGRTSFGQRTLRPSRHVRKWL
eukprot:gene11096-14909_t